MTAPGWYPDQQDGGLRYWDGARWTAHHAPVPPPPPAPGPDVHELSVRGRRARGAVLALAPVQIASAVLGALSLRSVFDLWGDMWDDIAALESGVEPYQPDLSAAVSVQGFGMVSNLLSLVYFVLGLFFVLWLYQAAVNARRLGRPARRSPVWAWAGWLIPIGNLFLPYQSARDLFPAGHAGRGLVARWWALFLGSGLVSTVAMVVAALMTGAVPVLVAGLVTAPAAVGAALAGRSLVDTVEVDQRAVAGAA
ncbi:MAG TPA: DUF4328 domain-containing protein [Acidimicrobiales bacterium]|nr:DUF4328 domain-containing protein [Acidimicrobiales bacterium]